MDLLQGQEKVVDAIEEKLVIVDENNQKSHHIVKAMGSKWGYIVNLFTSPDTKVDKVRAIKP